MLSAAASFFLKFFNVKWSFKPAKNFENINVLYFSTNAAYDVNFWSGPLTFWLLIKTCFFLMLILG